MREHNGVGRRHERFAQFDRFPQIRDDFIDGPGLTHQFHVARGRLPVIAEIASGDARHSGDKRDTKTNCRKTDCHGGLNDSGKTSR